MANRCLLLKCSTEGGVGQKKFWTKQEGNPQGWDSALTVLVPRKEKSLKRCQEKEECLVAFPQVYLLSLKNELKTPHKLP